MRGLIVKKCYSSSSTSCVERRRRENMLTLCVLLTLLASLCEAAIDNNVDTKTSEEDEVLELFSVVKGTAHLPCNLTAPTLTDGPRLVLWYKDGGSQPIYSYDARFTTIKHWSELRDFSARAEFR